MGVLLLASLHSWLKSVEPTFRHHKQFTQTVGAGGDVNRGEADDFAMDLRGQNDLCPLCDSLIRGRYEREGEQEGPTTSSSLHGRDREQPVVVVGKACGRMRFNLRERE